MADKQIVVLYHRKCPDGFGAAYAAWKKYGDMAEYIPVSYGDSVAKGLDGREVFLLDFCYELPGEIEHLRAITKRLVVIDHHGSSKRLVESVPEHVFDTEHSGAILAWTYFHPETTQPLLLEYIEDHDLYRHQLPQSEEMTTYITIHPRTFEAWDKLAQKFDQPTSRVRILETASYYSEYFNALVLMSVNEAKKIKFEGHECYFATTHATMRSQVADALYSRLPPFALVVSAHPDGFGVSIRGDGSVDVSKIAEKYGGGGHPNSSGFFIRNGTEMPWIELED